MAARRGNKAWLRQQLAKVLKWDADTAEGVVEAVAAAGNQDEVDALVEAMMGGDAAAANLVRQFRGPPGAGTQPPPAPPAAGMQLYQRDSDMRQLESSLRSGGGAGSSRQGRLPPQAVELAPPPPADKAKPVLDMGRNVAVTVKPARKKGGGGGGEAGSSSSSGAAKSLAKPVVNCLRCGKIYDCRSMSDEAVRFLESGGICSFCGNRVALRYADGSTNMAGEEAEAGAGAGPQAAAGTAAGAAGSQAAGELAGFKPEAQQGNAADAVAYNDSQAAAVALRDRLVEYDRSSAKRTTVLDDQSDFFEIDANAWLTDEERAVLKQREREMAEAEEARRRRVMVTIDLLGRKVVVDSNDAEGSAEAAAAAEASALTAQLDAALAAAAAKALAATSAEAAQGGGAAAPTALAAVEERLRDLRITVNPSMAARHFVFLPQQQQQQQQRQQQQQPAAGARHQQANVDGGAAAAAAQQGSSRGGSSKGQRQRKPAGGGGGISRLQHDDPFLGFEEVQVLAADEAGRHALEAAAGAAQAVSS